MTLSNGAQYNWTCNKHFANDWQWTALKNSEILLTSLEPLDIFKQNGKVTFNDKTKITELFITLGIHLRNSAKRKSLLTRVMGVIIIIILLLKILNYK